MTNIKWLLHSFRSHGRLEWRTFT